MRKLLGSPIVLALGAALLVAFPLLRLSCDFQADWSNHKWLTAYYGEYVLQHLRFPVFIHTKEVAGMAYPLFYGVLFYPLLGSLSILVNVDLVLRGTALLILSWQVLRVRSVALELGWESWHATALGGLVVWAIYPVTNLYFRSALTEFFAYGLLVGALTYLWEGWLATDEAGRRRCLARAALSYVVCAGSHPVTAILGGLTLAVLLVLLGLRRAPTRRTIAALSGCALLSVLALSPWLWAVAAYGRRVMVSREAKALTYFRDSIDSLPGRLLPFASDLRLAASSDVETPFLCAQASLPLVVLWLVVGHRARRRGAARGRELAATAVLAASFSLVFWLSVGSDVGGTFAFVQFAYRFVNYVNLVALAAILWYSHRAGCPYAPVLVALLAAWAGTAGAVHATNALSVAHDAVRWRAPADLRHLPVSFYGAAGYVIPDVYPEWSGPVETISMPVGKGAQFGVLGSRRLVVQGDSWVCTPVQSFPWARPFLDERPVAQGDLRQCDSHLLAVHVGDGEHDLQVRYDVPTLWRALRWTMWVALLMLAIVAIA